MGMEPYDPRQWSNGGQILGSQMALQQRTNAGTRHTSGAEDAMPSPPPPYSSDSPAGNGPVGRPSGTNEATVLASSNPAGSASTHASIHVLDPPRFPPPPAQSSRHRERSSAGLGSRSGFFNMANMRASTSRIAEQPVTPFAHSFDPGQARPPAARRAASAGQLQGSSSSATASFGSQHVSEAGQVSSKTWQPGMPLPGPPPGPPPTAARSQSLTRGGAGPLWSRAATPDHITAVYQHRGAAVISKLGPVPPTPADWIDTGAVTSSSEVAQSTTPDMSPAPYQPLRIVTGTSYDNPTTRRPAMRNGSAQGLRERRSSSRAARDSYDVATPSASTSKLDDLVSPTTQGSISRRREHVRRASRYASKLSPASPPYKHGSSNESAEGNSINTVLTPPYTPAPGVLEDEARRIQPLHVPACSGTDRPISHLLHQPVEDSVTPAPLKPSCPSSASRSFAVALDSFASQAVDRHRAFAEKETAASSDEERLELFANFIVHESRLRRDRYSVAYNAMAGDIVDLTRDLWRSYTRQGPRVATPSTPMSSLDATIPSGTSDGRPSSASGDPPSSASSFRDCTPGTERPEAGESMQISDSRHQGKIFMPCLSPIPSMNMSTVATEEGSRGRTPSRWWESSNSGSGSVGKPDRIEKSRRETKYMGVNPMTLQEASQPSPQGTWHTGSTPGPSTEMFPMASIDYPPEKVGWHESSNAQTPIPTPVRLRKSPTPGVATLEVSRLVTLPPPYPRHHPAVQNKHPLLSDLRIEYRALANREAIQAMRDAYLEAEGTMQRHREESTTERRRQMRFDIQRNLANGSLSFAEAAQAEEQFEDDEADRGRANARSAFDVFETNVAHPLNALLTERLEKANQCIAQLRAELESRDGVSDPNHAQEEGDEQPERLEKLTLLKWLFESREQLHKDMFELHADRSAKYSEVILTPYRIAKLQAKIDEANAFFAKDTRDRQAAFVADSLKRYEELELIVESNVSRGVEDQLSAFWDIAPGLLEVLQQVPSNIAELDIQIPEQEYEENPAYIDHPLQYFYSLLSHAQKSTYQFIESQINLLCLLHEVRIATAMSRLRGSEEKRLHAGHSEREDWDRVKQAQEERLTHDLKEKVGEVERQWDEALGRGLEKCRARVRLRLEEGGGWEDALEE